VEGEFYKKMIEWLDQYYPDDTGEPNIDDVDTALKLCLYCMRSKESGKPYIVTTRMSKGNMFWWVPLCPGWSQKKGKEYGPGDKCPYNLESVFAKRRFVFPCFEDIKHIFWLAIKGKIDIVPTNGKWNDVIFRKGSGNQRAIEISVCSLISIVDRAGLKKRRVQEQDVKNEQ